MKNIFVVCLLLTGLNVRASYAGVVVKDTLYAAQLKPMGRTILNQQKQLELITSAAHFAFSFKGLQCALYISIRDLKGYSYFQYELDGVYQKKVRVDGSSNAPIILKASQPGKHTINLFKTTEASTGPLIISKIAARDIKSLAVPKLPVIEFIGNSITCGAASDATDVPCGTGMYYDHHNAYMSYGARVARALHTDFVLNSVSGMGMYRMWDKNSPSMPLVYENTNLQVSSPQQWDFNTYSPKIVSICLGTNDMSGGDGSPRAAFDTVEFTATYVKFVKLVKSKYPKARIVLLGSPIIRGGGKIILQSCLTNIKKSIDRSYPADRPVATYFFKTMILHGCNGHPSVDDHRIMALELVPFFKSLLK